jgi:hypothetical protein
MPGSALVVRMTFASIQADWRAAERRAGRSGAGSAEPSLWRAFVFDKGWKADRLVVVIPNMRTEEASDARRHAYRDAVLEAHESTAARLWEQHRREEGLRVPNAPGVEMRWVGERVDGRQRWLWVPFAVDGRLLKALLYRWRDATELELLFDRGGFTAERDPRDPPARFAVLRWDRRRWWRAGRATWLRSEPWNLWRTAEDRERLRAQAEAAVAEALEQVGGWR